MVAPFARFAAACARGLVLAGGLALFALSLFASGTMAGRGADGLLTVELCVDGATMLVTLDASGKPVSPKTAEMACPWAVAHLAVALPPLSRWEMPGLQLAALGPGALPAAVFRPAHDPHGIWARGPPHLI
jgi:hypothetical protein